MRWFINSIKNNDFKGLPIMLDRLKKWIFRPDGLYIGDIMYIGNEKNGRKIINKFYNWKEGVWFVTIDTPTPMDIPYEYALEIRERYLKRRITETIGTYINNMNNKINK